MGRYSGKYLQVEQEPRPQGQALIWCILLLPFLCPFLMEVLGFPSLVRYLMDLCWVGGAGFALMQVRRLRGAVPFCCWIGVFLAYVLIAYCFLFQSPFYFLWGLRNNFRFYLFFLTVICLVRKKDRGDFLRCLDMLFWVNFLITLVQFFLLDYEGDFLGGIFGVQKGVNGYTNIFLVICLTRSVLWFFNGQENMLLCFLKVGACILIAALTELKFFFVETAVILVLCAMITKFSWKKLALMGFSAVVLVAGAVLLLRYFPEFTWFFRLDTLLEAAISEKGYTLTGDLNRLNAIGRISRELMDSPWDQIFGFGLGNCDTASFGFLQTPFSVQYEHLHYSWLSTAFWFLETGWIGLVLFFGFFGLVFWKANKLRSQGGENQPYCQLAMVMAVICCLVGVYNASLRTEAGYMAYLIMAFPFVGQKM